MSALSVTLVQSELYWEDARLNLVHFTRLLNNIDTDVVVLPEMFTTGFSMSPARLAEKMNGVSVQWMLEQAAKHNILLIGSLIIAEEGQYYNRLVAAYPQGFYLTYDKKHLFRMAGENEVYAAGDQRLTFMFKDWKICPLVCYDLRFPVWSRNALQTNDGYDLLVYVANWPARRAAHWRRLLAARAIENQCYVAAVNRVGRDGNQIDYRGDSCLLDYNGEVLTEMVNGAGIQTLVLNKSELIDYRQKFPAWQDADRFVFE